MPRLMACMGAILSHGMPDGAERTIVFASQTISTGKQKYSQIERLDRTCCLGANLCSSQFALFIDHQPLLSQTSDHPVSARSSLYTDPSRGTDIILHANSQGFRTGTAFSNADALRCLPC